MSEEENLKMPAFVLKPAYTVTGVKEHPPLSLVLSTGVRVNFYLKGMETMAQTTTYVICMYILEPVRDNEK